MSLIDVWKDLGARAVTLRGGHTAALLEAVSVLRVFHSRTLTFLDLSA